MPIARAQLVRLQGVEDAQGLPRVAADRQIIDRGIADDAPGIDDEGRTQADALVLVQDAERAGPLARSHAGPLSGALRLGVTLLPEIAVASEIGVTLLPEIAVASEIGGDPGLVARPREAEFRLFGKLPREAGDCMLRGEGEDIR